MLSDFERKVSQIIRNDKIVTGRFPTVDDLERRTGHDAEEIRAAIDKLKQIPFRDGGLGQ